MKNKTEQLINIAKDLVGRPYKYGAKTDEAPNCFDCSLFTQYVFKQIGVKLPRSTILQAEEGKEISLGSIEPGDLMFFRGERGFYNKKFPAGIGHVVLYAGEGKTIHAASERVQENPKVVESGKVEEKDLDYIMGKCGPLIAIKRIL